ncbi:head closure [Acinetobacter phage vB_AbaM_Kimel]|uniref:Head completion nuclease n=3 Tax=Lazarusvirus kimel TaxID=2843635 RepID=A0A6B9LWQ3_9CAUD|nr:head closure [Acinetobacter phage vB_AbaM_Kimel]QHB48313.1 head completion protein [Acinetobacter phage vB_AbaM_Kimel]QKE55856.1 head completion protein [Acinetobacter phage Octan]QNO11275.1 head completion protein [Acinetobacter phage Meroveus]
MNVAYSGKYIVKNKSKYKGHVDKVTYRSSWEKWYFNWLDTDPRVKYWSSEEVVIQYFSHADGRKRRYFMDIWFKTHEGQEFFIEIKPKKETMPPKPPAKLTAGAKRRYENECYTWQVNLDKWKAAQALAEKRNVKFRVLTEEGLRKLGAPI